MFLWPLKFRKRDFKFATFDIEANEWTKLEMVGFYDGRQYWRFDSIGEFISHFFRERYRGYTVFGHYAGKYDTLFVLDYLQKNKSKMALTYIMQGSKAVLVKLNRGRNTWSIADSSALFPSLSLAKLTKAFDVENKKLEGAIDFEKERVDKNNPLHQEYLKNDCIGLYQVIEKFKNNPKVKEAGITTTIASQAMKIWRTTLKNPIKGTSQKIQNFVRGGYVGGRVEIFKMRGENLNGYDVNSLYPSCMFNSRIPTEYARPSRNIGEAIGFFDVTVKCPGLYIPLLPLKMEKKLIFPNGNFRGVFFSEELKLAIEHGYTIEKIHEGHEFYESKDLFSEYIDFFNRLKTDSKDEGARLIAKLMMNSLYGKFGQREKKVTLKTHGGEKNYDIFHSLELFEKTNLIQVTNEYRSGHMLVHIAAAITSYARMHMAKLAYLPHGEECYYTDTDSVFTTKQYPTGPELGSLKLEYESVKGNFKNPKAYMLLKHDKIIASKIKGFSQNFIKSLSENEFEAGIFKENKNSACTLKRSLISNGNYLSVVGVTKQLRSEYNKRRVLKSGDTEPWVIKNGEIINLERGINVWQLGKN